MNLLFVANCICLFLLCKLCLLCVATCTVYNLCRSYTVAYMTLHLDLCHVIGIVPSGGVLYMYSAAQR